MARDNSCTFTVPGLIIRLSNVRFRPTVCGSNLLASFRQASKPAPRVVFCTMSDASPSRSSASANVELRIDFERIGTSFDIVNIRYWCVLLSCPVKSFSRRWDHSCCHVLKLESPILPRSRFRVKVHQLGKCSRLGECSVSSGCPVLKLDFRSHLNICSIPVPAFQQVRQLSLQSSFSAQLGS